MKKELVKTCLLAIFLSVFFMSADAQELRQVKIQGKVLSQGNALELAVVELLNSDKIRITSAITNKNGTYAIEIKVSDSLLFIQTSYYGLKTIIQAIEKNESNPIILNINLDQLNIESLNEVTITTDADVRHEVNKSVYKVRSKDYLKNAPTTEIFNNIPGLYYDEINGVLIENRLKGKIYINGLEASPFAYQALNISEIDKMEVITTPSAKYGSEFTGGIINVVTKTESESFIKGRLDGGIGLLRDSYSLFPNLSFKNKKLILKSYYSILDNRQNIEYSLNRTSDEGIYILNSTKKPHIIQQTGSIESKLNISDKDFFFANFSISKISENALQYGSSIKNSNAEEPFLNEEISDFNRTDLNTVYQRLINKNELYLKAKIFWYERNNDFKLETEDDLEALNTTSKLKEISGEINYDIKEKTLFKKLISYSLGVKFINRESNTEPSEIDFNQELFSVFAEYNYKITDNFSHYFSLLYETTKDKNSINLNRKNDNLLPTISFNKKFKKDYNLNYSFSKRIIRPGIYYLNDAPIFINPGVINRGNSNLASQKNYSHRLSLNNKIKKTNIILTGYYNYLDDIIAYNSEEANNLLINFYDNIGKSYVLGADLSVRATILTKINTNISSGIQYNKYEFVTNTYEHINDGYSYSMSLSVNTKVLKDKLSIAFGLNYKSPLFNVFTITNENPYTYLRLSTNVFKDKLNINLSYSDLFNIYSKTEIDFRNLNTFQNTIIDNRISNVSIGFSYNFGKIFNDRFNSNNIRNNDLKGD